MKAQTLVGVCVSFVFGCSVLSWFCCVCVRACALACVRACVRSCVGVCVCGSVSGACVRMFSSARMIVRSWFCFQHVCSHDRVLFPALVCV